MKNRKDICKFNYPCPKTNTPGPISIPTLTASCSLSGNCSLHGKYPNLSLMTPPYTGAGCNDREISGRPADHRSVLASTDQENNLPAGEERQLYLPREGRQGDPFRYCRRLEEEDRDKTEKEAIDCETLKVDCRP